MEAGFAVHRWPASHFHDRGVSTLTYSVDKHRPPRDAAITFITFKDRRATCAHSGHQVPPLTNPGFASHSCPAEHPHHNFVSLFTYCIHPHDAQLMLAFPRALTSFCRHTLDTNGLYSHSWALHSTDVRAYTSTSMELSN